MSNVIQIKTGHSQPIKDTLKKGELGYDFTGKKLYIGGEDGEPLSAGGGVSDSDGVVFCSEEGGESSIILSNAESFGGVPFDQFFDGEAPRVDRAASTQALVNLEKKIEKNTMYFQNQIVPLENFKKIYYSSATYTTEQCIDYCIRTSDVSWSDGDITSPKGEDWVVGKQIVLVISCDNGDIYVSNQLVTGSSSLQPISYWVCKNGDTKENFPILGKPDDYAYAVEINFADQTIGDMYADVILSGNDANSGRYASINHTFGSVLTLYAMDKPGTNLQIPLIILRRIKQ